MNIIGKHNHADTKWHHLETCPVSHETKWVKFEDGVMTIRTTIPEWLALQIIENNKAEANAWKGWSAAKQGAVVARVPLILDNELKKKAGYDPTKGGDYDQDKYNSFLDDIDYRHLRTGGGKIGKRKADVAFSPKRMKKLLNMKPLITVAP